MNRTAVERVVLISAFLGFTALWSYRPVTTFYALNPTSDFDLLVKDMFDAAHVFDPRFLVFELVERGVVFLYLPIFLTHQLALIYVLHSAFLASAVFPLYSIARQSKLPGLVALSYLLYPPVSAIAEDTLHYEATFPLLFFLGCYLYAERRPKSAFAFLAASALVKFQYIVFPALFGVYLALKGHRGLGLALLAVTGLVFLGANLTNGNLQANTTGQVYNAFHFNDPFNAIVTLAWILGPFLLVPILSKWSWFLAPIVVAGLISTNLSYSYPGLFLSHNSEAFVPFLFLGAVEGLTRLQKRVGDLHKALVFVLVIVLVAFPVFVVTVRPALFPNASKAPCVTSTNYADITEVVNLIKPGAVLVSSAWVSDPYASPNPSFVFHSPLVTSGQLAKSTEMYVNPFESDPELFPSIFGSLLTSNFSLVAEVSGITLIQKGYSGPVTYSPLEVTCQGVLMRFAPSSSSVLQPDITLAPGTYSLTIWSTTKSVTSVPIRFTISDNGVDPHTPFGSVDLPLQGNATEATTTFTLDNFYRVRFSADTRGWSGIGGVDRLTINQSDSALRSSSQAFNSPSIGSDAQ